MKTHVDEVTETKFMRRANAIGQLPGERLRDLIYMDVHGMTLLEMMAKHHRELIDKQVPNQDQIRTINRG